MCVLVHCSYCMVVLVCCRVTVRVCWYIVELLYGCVGML